MNVIWVYPVAIRHVLILLVVTTVAVKMDTI